MKRVDLPTSVDALIDEQGWPRVRSFSWGGQRLPVISIGRTWMDDAGRHLLVMAAGEQSFELLLRRSDLTWRVLGRLSRESLA